MSGVDDESGAGAEHVEEQAWSVARLNREIKDALQDADDRFPTYVVGEISEVNPYSFGTFFQLRDIEEEAVISCLAWADDVETFEADLEDGSAAVVRGSVDFYPDGGETRLMVSDYWPVGEADRSQQLEKLREELAEDGLLDAEAKQPLPVYPDRIGLVTSPSGSAREDFTGAVHERSPGVPIALCGATVQGDGAVPSLVGAIRRLDRDGAVDVIVVTRGGGSDANLWCFNEEPVVRVIADCTTPVLVAVGHEDDETLAEAVADHRAMTPTEAGVDAVADMDAVRKGVARLEKRIDSAYKGRVDGGLESYDHRIDTAMSALRQRVANRRATYQRAADLEHRIETAYETLVADSLDGLDTRLDTALTEVEHVAETDAVTARAARGRVGDLEARIDSAYRARVDRELDALETRIDGAYRDIEADARIEAGTREAKRLRLVVLVLLAVLLLGAAAVALFLL
jgi:exodeoxyribonuclease VII large subunit